MGTNKLTSLKFLIKYQIPKSKYHSLSIILHQVKNYILPSMMVHTYLSTGEAEAGRRIFQASLA
jgi:hypothetical protein